MAVTKRDQFDIRSEDQVVKVRALVRTWSAELGFNLIDQTKIVTAASELARNTLIHGGGGHIEIEALEQPPKRGLRLVFCDEGPGIADIDLALRDGYTTGSGLGLGLGGSKRLVNEFDIVSRPGAGTRVAITRWRTA
jgi:serine/threonine-protein kinase RsbT